jgi:hypothetical protein
VHVAEQVILRDDHWSPQRVTTTATGDGRGPCPLGL